MLEHSALKDYLRSKQSTARNFVLIEERRRTCTSVHDDDSDEEQRKIGGSGWI